MAMWWAASILTMYVMLQAAVVVRAAPQAKLIGVLPGQPQAVTFKQYGGFTTIGETGPAQVQQQRHLFYYFVEAASPSPRSLPLTLWLNGGPGCSSLGGGAFTELGPFRPNSRGDGLLFNPYSWNRVSNMLFLESPSGVGFSYSSTDDSDDSSDDSRTAIQNLAFLLAWLEEYPEYQASKLFLTGESYAGHYIPQLADLILKYNAKVTRGFLLNLQGIAIGNPLLNFGLDTNATYSYLWSHGVISDQTFEGIKSSCDFSNGYPIREHDHYNAVNVNGGNANALTQIVEVGCSHFLRKAVVEIGSINTFDVTLDICKPSMMKQQLKLQNLQVQVSDSETVDVCTDDEVVIYLNRPAVQSALHANASDLPYRWNACSPLAYVFSDQLQDMLPLLGDLLQKGLRVWIYSGDQDSVVPLTGTRTQIDLLATKLKLSTTLPYSPWYAHGQVGGWTRAFENLTYATVRGAAHMVPYTQPQRALVLFEAFLEGKHLPSR
ncbi:hypothetical protein GOP47_0017638 [Adiantum capillus-veneris]|uniref:Carboxypeptidase n=1 Tax=Adiantum capillus-veneris TaxID=13818 RepID=A0A9D4UG10_ADICA|nr:hypothetical protein GOP47_0017638 [Adiantum capillus-veneris]